MGQAAERGLYMIEIIREESFDSEQEKRELPKNIRQIGSPDIGDRIYIENKVHEYMHPYDALQEKTVYVLLGRFENMIGRQFVFVEAAICLEEIAFKKGWITAQRLKEVAEPMSKNEYGKYLLRLADEG